MLIQIRVVITIVTPPYPPVEQHAHDAYVPHGASQPIPAVLINDHWVKVFPKGPRDLVEDEEGKDIYPGRGWVRARWMRDVNDTEVGQGGDFVGE